MKNYKFLMICMMLLALGGVLFAQQDYEIVHNFNVKYQQYEQAIKDADSLAQLNQIQDSITNLKSDFLANKELLDKSLYPYDFNGSFANLQDALDLRKKDFTQISTLKIQVSDLIVQIDTLNQKNVELFGKISDLEIQSQKDAETIKKLKHSISSLYVSLHKRDRLIMAMLDSLMPPGVREKAQLTRGEKQKVYSKAEKQNVISNVKRAIDDNIKFLDITSLSPKDIDNIKSQEKQFEKLWTGMNSKFAELYSKRGKRTTDINEIDIKFEQWRKALRQEAWNSISDNFAKYNINLSKFSNGDEFTNTVSMHIENEIQNAKLNGDQAKSNYTTFADSAWFGDIEPVWIPYLIDNKMLKNAQQDKIEADLAQWRNIIMPTPMKWIYIVIIAALIAIGVIFYFVRSSKKKKKKVEPLTSGREVKSTTKKSNPIISD